MFKHILVPLDGSDVAEVALPIARDLAKQIGAKITMVRVVDVNATTRSMIPPATDAGGLAADMQEVIDESIAAELKEAENYLSAKGTEIQKAGVEAVTHVRRGVAGDEGLAAIEEEGVDVAAIATHGRSGISRTIFGSVAD